jgi:alpha-galactosidase
VLNLARQDVKDYVFDFLDKLVSENDIAFLKWDYNRNWSEPGWPEVAVQDQKKIWVKYVLNLYDVIDRLRAKHPKLEIESCSGGGGRTDLGILRRTEEVWPSDNTDALDRLYIQYGFTHAYPPDVMMAWVTDPDPSRPAPLKFRFLVAMNGSLGIGGNLNRWSEDDMALAANLTSFYKGIRETVQKGRLYRLSPPDAAGRVVNEYVSQDGNQVALFAFLGSQHLLLDYPVVRLRDLEENALYRLRPLDPGKVVAGSESLSGAYLMHAGLSLRLRGNYDSTALVLEKLP